MRYLITILAAMTLALGACQAGDDTQPAGSPTGTIDLFGSPSPTGDATLGASPTETAEETADASPTETADASPTETADASPTETADASPTGTPDDDAGLAGGDDCEQAFEDVPQMTEVQTLGDLQEFLEAIDTTIQDCESVDEWTSQAEQQLGFTMDDQDAEDFLRARCDESETLSETDLCQDL